MRIRLILALVAAPLLCAQEADRARSVLRDAFVDKSPDRRMQVAVALSLVGTRDPVADILVSLAKDKDVLVRQAAITSLSELGDRSKFHIIREALGDETPEVAFTAAKALWAIGDPEAKDLLLDIYDEEAKGKSGFLKKEMRNTMRRMKTPKSAFLFAVQSGIGFVPVPGLGMGYSAMTQMLIDNDFSPRATSLVLVCQKKDSSCTPMLERAWADDDWSVRAAAVQLVAGRRDTAYRAKLAGLFEDKNDKVRFRAAAAYLRLSAPVGRPAAKKK